MGCYMNDLVKTQMVKDTDPPVRVETLVAFVQGIAREVGSQDMIELALRHAKRVVCASDAEIAHLRAVIRVENERYSPWPKGFF